ncbi:MAG: glycosyltransferase family 2 protein [Desulfuromonadales bacterium]|nr:glycosyltransferase family 2 protein [Desulfuromonadales bacterium]
MSLALATLTLITHLAIAAMAILGSRRIPFLRTTEPVAPEEAPPVSIVVAARNEQRHIREGLQSLLQLDYPALQLVVVNDRSEDGTGAILADLAGSDRRLQVIEIGELPPGWLGKNHALWRGSAAAHGELLLFTDADVVMAPETLARAVGTLQRQRLDHLAVTPEARMPGWLLNCFGLTFGFFFALFTRPWQVTNPKRRAHIGIGAFNLVRSATYRRVGGHRTIAMRPDDDLKLGKIIKRCGARQGLLYGTGLIRVEWYGSVAEMVRGLEKNLFAGTDYRIGMMLGGIGFNLLFCLWPYLALLLTGCAERSLYAAGVTLLSLAIAANARVHGYRAWYALGFPLTAALFTWTIARTLTLNLIQGGIYWRGTFYPLDELKKNRV